MIYVINLFKQGIKGEPFKFPGGFNESSYDFIFMHLIANFQT